MQIHFDSIEKLLDAEDYDSAIASLETILEDEFFPVNAFWYLGLAYLLQGNEGQAQDIWLSGLLREDSTAEIAAPQSLVDFLAQQVEKKITTRQLGHAKLIYDALTTVDPDYINRSLTNRLIIALYEFGNYLRSTQDYTTALAVYKELVNIDPNQADSWRAIANCQLNLQDYDSAADAIRRSIELAETDVAADFQLYGIILEKKEQDDLAIATFEAVIKIDPNCLAAYACLGRLYLKNDNIGKAIEVYKNAVDFASDGYSASIYEKIAAAYSLLENQALASYYLGLSNYIGGDYRQAVLNFEAYLSDHPQNLNVVLKLANAYACLNQYDVAIDKLSAMSQRLSDRTAINVVNQAILPLVYQNHASVTNYRQRYEQLLDELLQAIKTYSPAQFYAAFNALPMRTTYHLGYQGYNDLALNSKYRQYIYQVTQAVFPDNFKPQTISDDIKTRPVKIGYVSTHFDRLGKLYLNWIKQRNHARYQVYAYDISGNDQTVNHQNRQLSFRERFSRDVNQFRYLTGKVENIASQILTDNLDILIFPDIGLSAKVEVLSTMRLAPLQCAAWGHPMTSGSANIDYFLSSELMEPDNAADHYAETLIKLPNLGFSLIRPAIPELSRRRSDFQLPETAIIYLCCQSIFKYLPAFDHLFPLIAQRNPLARFILIDTHPRTGIIQDFKDRLKIAFNHYHLDYEEWFIFIAALPFEEYLMLLQLSDIFLDTFAWSGGITTIDAIACGLPIVTCPGEMMRSRQSYGMLKMIGVTETIAKDEADYIDIAVRLGQDVPWRQSVRDKMQANQHQLFNDHTCIVALEAFFEQAIATKLAQAASASQREP